MAEFFAELKRRQMYRVAAAYAVVAWLLLQLINNLTPALRLPDWAATFLVVLLIVGFPVALLFCWIQHLPADGATQAVKTAKVDWLLIGALGLVSLLIAYQQIAPSSDATRQAGVEAARDASASPATAISLAVLPFANLSGDATQEFFSDGMTEEITSALAKIRDLRVVGRTSAYQFKDERKDLRAIGQALNATHLIEGSVRKEGDRVRITAQLIEANSGVHLWTENYDRQLTGVFTIQEDIARAIAASLQVPLGLNPGENLVNNRSIDPQSYELYLRAKGLYDARGQENLIASQRLFEQVVTRNPGYAPAWAYLCANYFLLSNADLNTFDSSIDELRPKVNALLQKAEPACQKAIALDPNFSFGYGAYGAMVWAMGRPLQGDELFQKALAIDPRDALSRQAYGIFLAMAGRLKEALAQELEASALEPFAPLQAREAADYLWLNGRNDEAIARAKTLRPADRAPALARIYASTGRFAEAADALTELTSAGANSDRAREASRLLRTAPVQAASPQGLPRIALGIELEFVYLYAGAPERALDNIERRADAGFVSNGHVGFVWHPAYAAVRKTERFKTIMRKVGNVEYWRAKGWPAQCQPTTGDDFVCE